MFFRREAKMGCGASANVRERLDYIMLLEGEVQDLKAQRAEALQRITVSQSEKENVAVQSLRNRGQAGQARKMAVKTQQQAIVEKSYLEAQYARAKANEEQVLRELKDRKTEHELLKLEFSSAKLQHTAHVKHLERDIHILKNEKVSTVRTLTENYELILHDQLAKHRDMMEEVIEFLTNIVELADGLKVKQIKLDSTVDIERRQDILNEFNKIPLADYVKDAKEFLTLDPLLEAIGRGHPPNLNKSPDEIEKDKLMEAEHKFEQEQRKQEEKERAEREREERARVRALAEEAPKLQKEVAKMSEQLKTMKKENDDLKVQLARQGVALKTQARAASFKMKSQQEGDFSMIMDDEDTFEKDENNLKDPNMRSIKFRSADPGLEAAEVELRLDRKFDDVVDEDDREKFEELFLADVAKALGVPAHLIQIQEIREGSIIVKFKILPPMDMDDDHPMPAITDAPAPPMQLARRLEQMMTEDRSPLREGIVTCSTLSVKSQPSSAASSAPPSARKHAPQYDAAKAAKAALKAEEGSPEKPLGRREEARRAREAKKLREALVGVEGSEQNPVVSSPEKREGREGKEPREPRVVLPVRERRRLEALEREQERAENEEIERAEAELAAAEAARRKTEENMREAERRSGALDDDGEIQGINEVSNHWWMSHQNHKLVDDMEVCSESIGDPNRHVRVYIHTTFKEFVEERRDLARHVFPELMHLCSERGVAFSPIDLFWQTVDLAEATQPEQLHYALDEVDSCNYWLFWFGGCYGWIPPAAQFNVEAKNRAWLSDNRGESNYAQSLGEVLFDRAVITDLSVSQGKAFFYFRDEMYGEGFEESVREQFLDPDPVLREMLAALKEKMRQTHMQVLEDYTEPMNSVRQAFEDLQGCIQRDFPPPANEYALDTLRERHVHTAMANSRQGAYIPVEEWVYRVHAHLDTRQHVSHPLVIVAPEGGGKTAFVANYVSNYRGFIPQALWVQYHVGCCAESTNYQRLCYSVMQAIKERFKIEEPVSRTLKPHEWQKEMMIWLGMAATRGRMVLVLDGLDQMDNSLDNALDLQWLPRYFPAEVRTIITCAPGHSLDSLLERGWPVMELEELDLEMRAEMIERYTGLQNYPSLDFDVVQQILEMRMSNNCTFLLQLADEMCMMSSSGRGKDQGDYLMHLQAQDITSFYDYLLWKWESFFDSIHPNFVRRVTCLIWGSRWGLSDQEILNILCDIPRIGLLHFFKAAKFCWHWSDGMVNFSHRTLRVAVEYRYLPTKLEKIGVHRQLGGYFRTLPLGRRRLDEEAWQWMQGESWLELLTTINNFSYFPRLYDPNDGIRQCDLRRYYHVVNEHLDAANGLLQGIQRFEATKPEPSAFFTTAQMLADFFAHMGRPVESAEMYRKMLSQPEDVLNSSFAMRLRIAGLRVSMARLLRQRWDQRAIPKGDEEPSGANPSGSGGGGASDFALLNEARTNLDLALVTYADLVLMAEEAYDTAMNDRDLPESEKRFAEKVLEDTRREYADVLGLLGRLCLAQGDYEGGEEYLMKGLAAYEKYTHSNHPAVGVITQGLAELYSSRRKYAKAEAMARRTVMVRHLCYGWNHPQFAFALATLSTVLRQLGNDYEADVMLGRQAKILAMYPDSDAVAVKPPDRTMTEDTEGATAWQGTGGSHGGTKSSLKTSVTHQMGNQVALPWPVREEESDEDGGDRKSVV